MTDRKWLIVFIDRWKSDVLHLDPCDREWKRERERERHELESRVKRELKLLLIINSMNMPRQLFKWHRPDSWLDNERRCQHRLSLNYVKLWYIASDWKVFMLKETRLRCATKLFKNNLQTKRAFVSKFGRTFAKTEWKVGRFLPNEETRTINR